MSKTIPNYLRVDSAVLAFIRNHPALARQEICKGLIALDPHVINVALFRLQEKGLVEGQYERLDNATIRKGFYPARLDRK